MKIIINGRDENLNDSIKTLADLLHYFDLIDQRIAVEVNGEIISRSLFVQTPLKEKDKIEIIKAVGGG